MNVVNLDSSDLQTFSLNPKVFPERRHRRSLVGITHAFGPLFCIALISCVLISCGGSSHTQVTKPTPDFSLTASPASVTLTPGGAGQQISVNAVPSNGFQQSVTVAITGLPTGVIANPATLTLTPGTAKSVTLTASSSATATTANITLTGSSGALTHTAAVAATVSAATPAPDFSLSVSPASVALVVGAVGTPVRVLATAIDSFTGTVSVAISGLPSGVTASPATLSLTPGTALSVTLTAAANATLGGKNITFTGTSGALTHTANLTATLFATAPPPDFSLSLSPTSLTLVGGQTGSAITVLATPINSFSGSVSVAISGLPSSVTANPATLTLTPGTSQNTTLTAAGNATAATSTVTFTATSGSLTHTSPLALTVQSAGATTTTAPDVTTYHYDIARDGLNPKETILTLSNVNSTNFGKIGFDTVDGLVDAEPLFLANLTAGGTKRNVLYVATEHDSIYAFDADTGSQIWKTSIIGSKETTSDDRNCGQITPEIGITSTPVIDRSQGPHGTIFAVGMTKDSSGNYHQRLHALDLTTGTEITGSPTEITASYPGSGSSSSNGNVIFYPSQYAERAALLLLNGNIYTTWTSHCDLESYTGWIIAYSESSLQQTQVLNITPNGTEGSVWMSGGGPAADSSGNIYFLDANGTFDTNYDSNGFPNKGDYGNAILKLSTSGKLAVTDYFETYNTAMETSDDQDLGSGGEILLPDQTDSNGKVWRLLVGAGKDANIYIADRDNMGKYNSKKSDNSNIYQIVSSGVGGSVFSTPAFFNGTLYYGAVRDPLRAFPVTQAKLAGSSSSQSATTFDFPGTTPGISANGTQNGIVWAVESNTSSAAVLHAYDATNLTHELYNSGQAAKSRDSFGNGNKFITPLIVNGKVYIGTPTGVAVFGLLNP